MFCPRCGAGRFRPRSDGKAVACEACGYQHWLNAVLAVAVLVADDAGRLLLIRRQREPARGKLAFPGGFSDAGEDAEGAARREVREEVNLELGPLRYVSSCANRYEYQGILYRTADVFYAAEALSLAPLRPLDDVAELLWLHPEAIAPAELAFDSMRHALACYRQER